MTDENLLQQEREYFQRNALTLNERLTHLRTPFYFAYYILFLYCKANSSYSHFPYTNSESSDSKIDVSSFTPFWQDLLCDVVDEKEKKILKRQIYHVFNELLVLYPIKN